MIAKEKNEKNCLLHNLNTQMLQFLPFMFMDNDNLYTYN